jgi:hypothetical protein
MTGTVRRTLIAFAAGLWLASALASAATITVNSASSAISDDGLCTLREAVTAANFNLKSGNTAGECVAGSPGLDTILFAIPGAGLHTLSPTASGAPTTIHISEPLIIDGFSQAGAIPNSNPAGQGLNAVYTIEIDLSVSGPLEVATDVSPVTIRGLVLNRSNQAAIVLGGGSASVEGCYIGTNPAGTAAGPGNAQGGIVIGSASNVIGGTTADKRNLISGNPSAAIVTGLGAGFDNNVIKGNMIGTNAAGTAAIANGSGVGIGDSVHSNNLIGGTSLSARNVISGNTGVGVGLGGITATSRSPGTFVQGNYIGTDVTGTVALPNSNGVVSTDSNIGNVIGGAAAGAGNLISGNVHYGVSVSTDGNVILRNLIGTNAAGTGPIPGHADGGVFVAHNDNQVGSTAAGTGNHIAFNSNYGVILGGGGTSINNRISSNSIHANNSGASRSAIRPLPRTIVTAIPATTTTRTGPS